MVVTFESKDVTLTLDASLTIGDLKEFIYRNDAFDIPNKEKLLLLGGGSANPLDDALSLSHLGNGILKLELVILLEVRVRVNRGDGDVLVVEIGHNQTVADLKTKLCECQDLAVDTQSLKQLCVTLSDDIILSSLRADSLFIVELQLEIQFSLRLEIFTGVAFELEVSSNELVDTLYAEVNRRARVPYHRQEIVYSGSILEIGTRISDYNVPHQATLAVNLRNYQMTVFLKTLTGQTIMITVTPRDTVAQVKAKIEQQEGIPVAKQRLIFVGNQLHDDHYFLDYRIEHESAVHLVVRNGDSFELYVQAPSGHTHVFEADPSDSVEQLKCKLRDQEGIPCDIQQFFFNEQLLSNDRPLAECNVISGSTLRLAIDHGRSTQIFVSVQTRESFPLWVNRNYTVLRVKQMIADKKGIAPEIQQIYFARTILADDRTLNDYTIETNHMLHVHVIPPPLLHFTVTLQGRPIECKEPANTSVLDLKSILAAEFNVSSEQQLFFEGCELEDACKLSECSITNGSNLDLILCHSIATKSDKKESEAALFVKTLTGKTVMLQVNSNDTVLALKQQIQAKEGVEVDHQCLVSGGKVLENQSTVSECGMQNQSILHLVLRVPS